MPVVLDPAAYDAWLEPERPAVEAKLLLAQNLGGALQFYRVDRQVNGSKFKGEKCIRPVNPAVDHKDSVNIVDSILMIRDRPNASFSGRSGRSKQIHFAPRLCDGR